MNCRILAYCCSIVPNSNVILAPLETSMGLLCSGNHLGKVSKNGITLDLGNTDDLRHEPGVEEQTVPPGDGVGPN